MRARGCNNGTLLANEYEHIWPDDRGSNNEGVLTVSLITDECEQIPARLQGV